MSNKILIIYPYFSPAEKAGGIVSSLVNMVHNLEEYQFYVYTSCYDLDGTQHTQNTNAWLQFSKNVKVYYSDASDSTPTKQHIQEVNPDKVYINGIYGNKFFLKPLLALKNHKIKVIIAPRGMLHQGALKVKPLKKKIYLNILKLIGPVKNVSWHATDQQEVEDIKYQFKTNQITLAQDTPPLKPKFCALNHIKKENSLKLVFLSLITEKKNLLFLLQLIHKNPQLNLSLDIIGPVKDQPYWHECNKLIEKNKDRVNYCGQVAPKDVVNTIAKYDFFILPTLGENFGHVIFEALTAGKPVITTPYSPWTNLENNQAGFNLELDPSLWVKTLSLLSELNNSAYQILAGNAQDYLKTYLSNYNPEADYKPLFSNF